MSTVDTGRVGRMGCALGQGVRSGRERDDLLVVLAFGRPMHHKGRFGASLFDGHFANAMKDLPQHTRRGGKLYVFSLP